MKIGLHLLGYECADFIPQFFEPWFKYKENNELIISVGHVCFKEFQELGFPVFSKDNSHIEFKKLFDDKKIEYYQFLESPLTEIQARTAILQPLIREGVDLIVLSAPDEFYTLEQIQNTVKYIEKESFIRVFNIEFKNLVFNEKTYTKGFAPLRAYRNDKKLQTHHFSDDDAIVFYNGEEFIDCRALPNKKIPVSICNPKHYTWLNNERSRDKVKYQERRWSPPKGFGCSFKWDEEKKELEFNLDYYKRTGQSLPELFYE